MSKTITILGLGLFGTALATQLAEDGYDVIGIDQNIEHVEEVSDSIALAVQGDFTKYDQLLDAGVKESDIAIIAAGGRLESTILGIMNLQKLGIKQIIVKTKAREYKEVLMKVGATKVILPEKEMGEHLAYEIAHNDKILSSYQFDENYRISELKMEDEWVGKAINEIPFRTKYGFNIIGIKENEDSNFTITVDPTFVVSPDNIFLVIHEMTDKAQAFFDDRY